MTIYSAVLIGCQRVTDRQTKKIIIIIIIRVIIINISIHHRL